MMESFDALKVISKYRGDALVVATMCTHQEWPVVSTRRELDLPFSVMGKASSLALGLALARPERKVIVFDGDGSLLMNLGTLVTITSVAPRNLIYFLICNGVYRSCSPGYDCPGVGKVSFTGFAKSAGFPNVYEFGDTDSLDKGMGAIMKQDGSTFVNLICAPNREYPSYPYVEPREYVDDFVKTVQSLPS